MQPFKLSGSTPKRTNHVLFSSKTDEVEMSLKDFKAEGVALAESGLFKQALLSWSTAVSMNPQDFELYEMQAQGNLSTHIA